jgi:hypothetical protein
MLRLFKRYTSNKETFRNYSKANAAYLKATNTTYLVTENAATQDGPITVTGWFKIDIVGGTKPIFWIGDKDQANEYKGIFVTGGGIYRVISINATVAQGLSDIAGTWNDGGWHFFAGVWTSNTSRHGRLDDTVSSANTNNVTRTANYDRTSLGSHLDSTPVYSQATALDNITLWNSELTNDELTWLRDNQTPTLYYDLQSQQGSPNVPDTTNLKGFWSLDERHGPRKDFSSSRLDMAMVRGTGLSDFDDVIIAVPGKNTKRNARAYNDLVLSDLVDWAWGGIGTETLNFSQTIDLTGTTNLSWAGIVSSQLTLNHIANYEVITP